MKKITILIIIITLLCSNIFANPIGTDKSFIKTEHILFMGGLLGVFLFRAFLSNDKIEFTDEIINIELKKDESIEVKGLYTFNKNGESDSNFGLIYPFPSQKEYGEIEIKSLTFNNEKITFYEFDLKRRDQIEIHPLFVQGENILEITFIQTPKNKEYYYILKSTKKWKKKLVKSKINLKMHANHRLESCNYEFNSDGYYDGDKVEYNLEKNNFMPKEDFRFSWENID